MASVICPRCNLSQAVPEGSEGYTCAECRTRWRFARCRNCSAIWHVQASVWDWECKTCGQQNTESPPPARASRGVFAHLRLPHRLARSASRSGDDRAGRSRVLQVSVGGAVIVAGTVAAVFFFTHRNGEPPAASATAAAEEALCGDLQTMQTTLRVDALGRAQKALRKDRARFRAAGDNATPRQIARVIRAVGELRLALRTQGDVAGATTRLQAALRPLPC